MIDTMEYDAPADPTEGFECPMVDVPRHDGVLIEPTAEVWAGDTPQAGHIMVTVELECRESKARFERIYIYILQS